MNLIIIYVNRFNFPSAIPNYAVSSRLDRVDFKNC